MDSISSTSDSNPFETSSSSSSSSSSSASSYDTTLPAPFATVSTNPPKRPAGRKKFRETRHPVYRGVRRRNGNKWVCEVREPNKKTRIWLGTFPTPEMAARAHDVAAMALKGRSACLNFADSVWLLPVPASANAKEIQKTAAEAAEAFRPSESAFVSDDEVEPKSVVKPPSPEGFFWMDEELNFGLDMPGLLASMAEGLLLQPPQTPSGFHWDDVEDYADVSLWSYSIPIGY